MAFGGSKVTVVCGKWPAALKRSAVPKCSAAVPAAVRPPSRPPLPTSPQAHLYTFKKRQKLCHLERNVIPREAGHQMKSKDPDIVGRRIAAAGVLATLQRALPRFVATKRSVDYLPPSRAFSNSSPFFQSTRDAWLEATQPRAKPKRAIAASEV